MFLQILHLNFKYVVMLFLFFWMFYTCIECLFFSNFICLKRMARCFVVIDFMLLLITWHAAWILSSLEWLQHLPHFHLLMFSVCKGTFWNPKNPKPSDQLSHKIIHTQNSIWHSKDTYMVKQTCHLLTHLALCNLCIQRVWQYILWMFPLGLYCFSCCGFIVLLQDRIIHELDDWRQYFQICVILLGQLTA